MPTPSHGPDRSPGEAARRLSAWYALRPVRRGYAGLAALGFFLLFYGSFVPLQWTGRSLGEALSAFRALVQAGVASGVRMDADIGVNMLLLIPTAFALSGALTLGWLSRPPRVLLAVVTLALCASSSVVTEFGQLFFAARTSSLLDIYAQWVGAATGVGLWLLYGPALTALLQPAVDDPAPRPGWQRALRLYAIGFFGYSVLPLDLTLRPAEVYQKWTAGRVILVPFSYPYGDLAGQLYAYATDVVLWMPIGVLALVLAHGRALRALIYLTMAAVTLESAQLLVQSRFTDATDVVLAVVGGGLALLVARRLEILQAPGPRMAGRRDVRHPQGYLWLLCGAYALGLVVLFTFPFDFDVRPATVRANLAALRDAPLFHAYQVGSVGIGLFDLVRTATFFAVLGSALHFALGPAQSRLRALGVPLTVAVAGATAVLIEALKLALPSRSHDATDILIAVLGAGFGYGLMALVRREGAEARPDTRSGAAVERVRTQAGRDGATSTQGWLPGLDGLRAVAALAVFCVHLEEVSGVQFGRLGPLDFQQLASNGNTGVALFFVLSGFLLSAPLWQGVALGRTFSFWHYLLRRMARIAPAYYLCLFGMLGAYALRGDGFSAGNILAHVVFLHSLRDDYFYAINLPFWTIAVEVQFYVLLGVATFLAQRARLSARLIAVLVCAALVVTYAVHRWLLYRSGSMDCDPAGVPSLTRGLLPHLPLFLGGVVAYGAHVRWPGRPGRPGLLWDVCFIGSAGLLIAILATGLDATLAVCGGRYNFPFVLILLVALVFGSSRSRTGRLLLDNVLARTLGTVSYGIYLFHVPVMKAVRVLFNLVGLSTSSHWLLFAAASLVVTLVVAACSYLWLERPVLRRTRAWSTAPSRRQQGPD